MADKRVILSDPLTQDRLFPAVIADNIFNADGTPFDLEGLKTSVSEGKALIAAAVTDKGVETAADATFETMAGNIELIEENYVYLPISIYISISSGSSTYQTTKSISIETNVTNDGISVTQELFDTMVIIDPNNIYFSSLQSGFANNGNWYKCRYDSTNASQSLGYTANYGNSIKPLPLYPNSTMTQYSSFTLSKYNFIDTMTCALTGSISKSSNGISIPLSIDYTAVMGGSLSIFAFIKVKFQ